jgi:hypothetical protein
MIKNAGNRVLMAKWLAVIPCGGRIVALGMRILFLVFTFLDNLSSRQTM